MDPSKWSDSTCRVIGYTVLAVLFFHNLPAIMVGLAIAFLVVLLVEWLG